MKTRVFADTGFWVALFDARDQYHSTAKAAWRRTRESGNLVTSELVVYETITYLNCSLRNHGLTLAFVDGVAASRMPVLNLDPVSRSRALELLRTYRDIPLSFVDCASAALMERERIADYAGFDNHFRRLGFSSVCDDAP